MSSLEPEELVIEETEWEDSEKHSTLRGSALGGPAPLPCYSSVLLASGQRQLFSHHSPPLTTKSGGPRPACTFEYSQQQRDSSEERKAWIYGVTKGLYETLSDLKFGPLPVGNTLSLLVPERLPTLSQCIPAGVVHSTRGLSLACFTLRESVGMFRGSSLPLDFVCRILSSKFWMMECDVYADLLIICRWANPTTIHCDTCDKEVNAYTTSCGHVVCRTCSLKKWLAEEEEEVEAHSCLQCGGKVLMIAMGTLELGAKRVHCTKDEEAPCSKRVCTKSTFDKSAQHRALVKHSKKIVESLSHEPGKIALSLFSHGFIKQEVLDQTRELSEIKTKKASRLYSAVLSEVERQSDRMDQFISILSTSEQSLHKKLVEELEIALKQ